MHVSICMSEPLFHLFIHIFVYKPIYPSAFMYPSPYPIVSICMCFYLSIHFTIYLSDDKFICPSFHLSICPSVHLFLNLPYVSLHPPSSMSIHLHLWVSLFMNVSFICLSIFPFVCSSVCLFFQVSFHLSVNMFMCLSNCL
jgi:hypothetical protein